MAAKLKAIKGKAVVSINDHPAIRECFAGFDMEALKLDYTVGGGANRVERGELVIYSWDRQVEPAGSSDCNLFSPSVTAGWVIYRRAAA